MTPPDIFGLSNTERCDPVWIKAKGYFELKIAELRERNDSFELDDRQTLKIRTEIALYKSLLKL